MDLGLVESNGLITTVLMLMTIDHDAVDDEYNLAESHLIWRKNLQFKGQSSLQVFGKSRHERLLRMQFRA